MFCEGVHLHLVLVVVFIKDNIAMRIFIVIGWIIPLIFVAVYSFIRSRDVIDSQLWVKLFYILLLGIDLIRRHTF